MWHMGNSLAGQWLGLGVFTTVAWVQSLVRELISCKSWGMADKRKKKKVTCGSYILRSCLFPPSNLNESLVGYEILAWKLFSLRTSKALFLYILTSRIATRVWYHPSSACDLFSLSQNFYSLSPELCNITDIYQYYCCESFVFIVLGLCGTYSIWKHPSGKFFLYNFIDNSLVCFICSIFQKFDFLNWFSKFLFSLFVLFFWKS